MNPFGFTRSTIQRDHALITPESHVRAALPGWTHTDGVILISPQMGARFSQYLAIMGTASHAGQPLPGVERFVYVIEGEAALTVTGETTVLRVGSYAYLPPHTVHTLTSHSGAQLTMFEKYYLPLEGVSVPEPVIGHTEGVAGVPFMGDEGAMLKTLLPTDTGFDMAVNLFSFAPGAALPLVEVHVMEHGLLLVAGKGIYRLADQWYPVQAGDAIWMAPYCPQWFTAVGKERAAYLYYKDVNRDPLG